MSCDAYLGLGSNLGDRLGYLKFAVGRLGGLSAELEVSGVYETEPVGNVDQPMFLNAVCRIRTELGPSRLLEETAKIENAAGRRRRTRDSPRTLDIDLLMYEAQVIESTGLTIPHPRMAEREFVLAPFAEIAPGLEHPVLGKSIEALLADLRRCGPLTAVSRLDGGWEGIRS